jgi:hypothetical protein
VKIEYKNDTSAPVNIRGKKLRPDESIVSQVFIKPFEEFVKKGDLTIYVDGVKIGFEQAPAIEAQITDDAVVDGESVEIPADNKALETVADKTIELAEPEKSEETSEVTAPEIPAEEKAEEAGSGGESVTETAEVESGEKSAEEAAVKAEAGDKVVSNAEAEAQGE